MLDKEKNVLQLIQEDLPLESRPFAPWARRLGISEKELIARIQSLKTERGYIRRYGAVLAHRNAGFIWNAMVVWDVPEREIDVAGNKASSFEYVTHCYWRERHAEWPYTLYAMIHALTEEQLHVRVSEVRSAVGDFPADMLISTKEFKKTSLRVL